ncbi:hypothetical protein NHH03_19475 [Stieleria sp. TO1_6]|uniref:hypothetical protein n=1 Tax=Stieleria tagensis TaxID=2956795 RepID=UPI00209AAD0C|nr:hypothetical protein [Stieleria tagensis]MCO8123934.1 hypothetical protein [Stieleria tagensis]
MDQERDTIGNSQNQQRGRFRPQLGESGPPYRRPPTPPQGTRPAAEPLPTLFELPDRTPEALLRRRGGQASVHHAHSGPPASHVDPPSGDRSELQTSGPNSPTRSDAHASRFDFRALDDEAALPATAESVEPTESKRPAFFDGALQEVTNNVKSWGAWSAMIFLSLMMATLAFLSGRGMRSADSPEPRSQVSQVAPSDSGELSEFVVEITDDVEGTLEKIQIGTGEAEAARMAAQQADSDTEALAQVPGFDNAATKTNDDIAPGAPLDGLADQPVPPVAKATNSVVGYRSQDSSAAEAEQSLADSLPPATLSESESPSHEFRYSNTPHPIGNFLEILKSWEAAE